MAENHFCSSSKNWYPHVIPVNTRPLGNHLSFSFKEAVQYTAPVYKVLFIDPLTPFIPWSNENTCLVLEDNHIIPLSTSSMFLLLLLRPWRYYYHCVCPVFWCSSIVCLKWTITLPKTNYTSCRPFFLGTLIWANQEEALTMSQQATPKKEKRT